MRFVTPLSIFCLLLASTSLHAQPPDPASTPAPPPPAVLDAAPLFTVGASEWMVTAGPAFGVVVFHSAGGHSYFLQTVSWGRVLTGQHGPGFLRGSFEWAFEVVPIFGQWEPTGTYGIGFTPLDWRWNFAPRGRLAPFAELAGGLLWTGEPVPVRTTTSNFTAHAGGGIRYLFRPTQSLVASYRFHHISNGNRLERNPGVNAHVLQVGWSLVRPGK